MNPYRLNQMQQNFKIPEATLLTCNSEPSITKEDSDKKDIVWPPNVFKAMIP